MAKPPVTTELSRYYDGRPGTFRSFYAVQRRYRADVWPPPKGAYPELLPYMRHYCKVTETGWATLPGGGVVRPALDAPNTLFHGIVNGQFGSDISTFALEKLWAKIVDAAGDRAALGTSLAEAQESLDMIGARAAQLNRSLRALRRWDLPLAYRELGLRSTSDFNSKLAFARDLKRDLKRGAERGLKRPVKDIGGAWLEYWLGWAPLLGDIRSALDVLGNTQESYPIKCRGTAVGRVYSLNEPKPKSLGSWRQYWHDTRVTYAYNATARVTSPKLRLARDLGFTNPAKVAYELMPFSFMWEWIHPIGGYLDTLDAFIGLNLSGETWSVRVSCKGGYLELARIVERPGVTLWYSANEEGNFFRRNLGKPPNQRFPKFRFPRLNPTRAATSISLLLQQLNDARIQPLVSRS